MEQRENFQIMAEDIINAITVIYGLFKLTQSSPESQEYVEREVRRIVEILHKKFLFNEKSDNGTFGGV
ncbi:MAG: hypothetical protein VR69_09675 [Peptococcaceae bacterium BRH_c4b]|nr:MAG: hypothetical protein VR69_09675 [Peptococcaceae bacterium BRH_c4b]